MCDEPEESKESKLIKINDYLESKGQLFNVTASKSGFKIRLVFDQAHTAVTFDEENFGALIKWAREEMDWKLDDGMDDRSMTYASFATRLMAQTTQRPYQISALRGFLRLLIDQGYSIDLVMQTWSEMVIEDVMLS